jgi:hypothetical protein
MGDNFQQAKDMAAPAPIVDPRWLSRVREAIRVLSPLDEPSLDEVVWTRLRGADWFRGLPRRVADEGAGDIFIEVVRYDLQAALSDRLRRSSARLLESAAPEEAVAAAELCFVAARIGAFQAIPPLTALAEREETLRTMLPGSETLYERALECLGGLLAALPGEYRQYLEEERHRGLFFRALQAPGCELCALTILVGLWPASAGEFRRSLPARYPLQEESLQAALRITFGQTTRARVGS